MVPPRTALLICDIAEVFHLSMTLQMRVMAGRELE